MSDSGEDTDVQDQDPEGAVGGDVPGDSPEEEGESSEEEGMSKPRRKKCKPRQKIAKPRR